MLPIEYTMDSVNGFLSQWLTSDGSLGATHILGALVVAYFGGILSSLTPCVYPMIPITLSVVGGLGPSHAGKRPWKQIWIRGASYVAGMTLVYSFLGVLAGLTGRVFGTLTNTPAWYLGLGLLLTLAALVMLEVIPFDPVATFDRLKRKFGKGHQPIHHTTQTQMSLAGSFVLGASSGFIAAPCTTPVLAGILGYIAKTQSVGLGLALMISFSLGLGTLLLLIATFAGALQTLPRSGQWMRTVKTLSGLILLAFAEYLIYRSGVLGGL